MPSAHFSAQRSKYRVTLEITAYDDFQPHNIDWEKLLEVQGNESVDAYVEDLSRPDKFYS